MILQTLFGLGPGAVKIKPAAQASTRVATGTPTEGNFGKFLKVVADATINTRVGRFLLTPIQTQHNERAIRRGTLSTGPVLESQNRREGLRRVVRRFENPILELGGKVGNVIREHATPLDALFGVLAAGTGAVKSGTTLINRRLPRRLSPRDGVDNLFGATRARPTLRPGLDDISKSMDDVFKAADLEMLKLVDEADALKALSAKDDILFRKQLDDLDKLFELPLEPPIIARLGMKETVRAFLDGEMTRKQLKALVPGITKEDIRILGQLSEDERAFRLENLGPRFTEHGGNSQILGLGDVDKTRRITEANFLDDLAKKMNKSDKDGKAGDEFLKNLEEIGKVRDQQRRFDLHSGELGAETTERLGLGTPAQHREADALLKKGQDKLDDLLKGLDDEAAVEIGDIIFQGPGITREADARAFFARGGHEHGERFKEGLGTKFGGLGEENASLLPPLTTEQKAAAAARKARNRALDNAELNPIDEVQDFIERKFGGDLPEGAHPNLDALLDNLDLADLDDSALLDQLIARLQGRPADIQEIMDILRKRRN